MGKTTSCGSKTISGAIKNNFKTVNFGKIENFRNEIETEWRENISPFWLEHAPDEKHGGFRGRVSNDLQTDEFAAKGIILNSRILWTFSHAYRIYKDEKYLEPAKRAFDYLSEYFFDKETGGVFWTVNYLGNPLDTKKRPYAQAFAIYALAEFFAATREQIALDKAFELFEILENKCCDKENDGYLETFERDWTLSKDLRLSEVDQNDAKSMNTHLHILEAYANLYKVSQNQQVKKRIRALLEIFLEKIIHPRKSNLQMFFDEDWTPKSEVSSPGHDIEASWLLCEAAGILGDEELLTRIQSAAMKMANAVFENGLAEDFSLLYEINGGEIINSDRDWWVQSEAVLGFANAFSLSNDEKFLTAAFRVWEFIKEKIIDKENGEWFWKIDENGDFAKDKPKIGQWKCPYHNGRMCFEMNRRLKIIESAKTVGI